ncbi:hypothetical protein CRUP_015170, partial [Coryphaenoides rupestris]
YFQAGGSPEHVIQLLSENYSAVAQTTPAWLEQMIAHTTWRDLFYKLAEAHPDCLMLNFTV